MRTGIVAQKVGMSRVFAEDGRHIPVTVLKLDNCQVIAQRTEEKDGYSALQLGMGTRKVKRISKAQRGQFAKAKVEPKAKVAEFRISPDAMIDVGQDILASHFLIGQKIDITGTSKGKGFAGAMKRHNFAGLRATHGVSISHRSHGSTGHCQDPGRVFKGKKMAGQMGNKRVTVQGLEIVETDDDRGLILVKGAVPGSKGGFVLIKDSVKAKMPADLPFPTALRQEPQPEAETPEVETEVETAADQTAPEAEAKTEAPVEAKAEEAPAAEAESKEE